MTLAVNRDSNGDVSVSYTSGATSISIAETAGGVSFIDNYVTPAAAPAEQSSTALAKPPADAASSVAAPVDGVEHLAFKCPACGTEFDEQIECVNQHPAEPTLPTQEVLAGAAPQDPPAPELAAPASEPSSADASQASASQSSLTPSDVTPPAESPQFPGQ